MIISVIKEFYIHLFPINRLINCYISPKNSIFLKPFNSEFSYVEVWFTVQNSEPLEIENRINITLIISQSVTYKKWHAVQFNVEMGKNMLLNWFLKYALNLHTDAFKSSSKRAIQRTTKGTSDLMWNKIVKKNSEKLYLRLIQRQSQMKQKIFELIEKYLKKDIYFQKRDRKLLMI